MSELDDMAFPEEEPEFEQDGDEPEVVEGDVSDETNLLDELPDEAFDNTEDQVVEDDEPVSEATLGELQELIRSYGPQSEYDPSTIQYNDDPPLVATNVYRTHLISADDAEVLEVVAFWPGDMGVMSEPLQVGRVRVTDNVDNSRVDAPRVDYKLGRNREGKLVMDVHHSVSLAADYGLTYFEYLAKYLGNPNWETEQTAGAALEKVSGMDKATEGEIKELMDKMRDARIHSVE